MEIAIGAARWVVGKALGPVTDGVLEAWAASSQLGPNIRALKLELLYAQGMLTSAQGRDVRNPALAQLLLELRHLAYIADDVLDELDYFRIQDELEGTYETVDDAKEEHGLVRGLVLHARHTARAITGKLACSCAASESHVDEQEVDGKQGGFLSVAAHAVSKRLPCCSLPSVHDDASANMPANERCFLCGAWSSKAQQRKHAVHEAKLKFDRVEMSNKMTDIVEQLKPVCAKVATILGLVSLGYSNSAKPQGSDLEQRSKTTPEIIEPELYGREKQKQKVAEDIINEYCVHDLTVLPVVGPGGIGKTTFVQHIYDKVKSHFQVSVWICVSQNFNANKLAEEIVNKIPESNNEGENESDQERIEKRIRSKQFLLVLDDVWTYHEDEWKALLSPFKKGGTKGNMVIVTTRIPKVAEMVELMSCSIKLKRLQHEDSMELFQACVGIKTWKDYPSDLKDVGTNIVKRLKGFPLAVKTVGRLLRNQHSLDRWTALLKSKEWELHVNNDDIMPALKLSYNYLPFHLQQCFSCCALFPEDYRFSRQELTNFWIGLGLLGAGDQNKIIEDIGLDCLNDLVDNGFFEREGNNYDSPYVIHDLLHELATNVSSYEFLRLNSSDVRSIQIPTSIRHMSVIIDNTHVKDRMTFENHKKDLSSLGKKLKAGNLHTIMLFGEWHGSFYKILGDILRDAKSLRVIFLSGASYNVEDLLPNFSKLVHLRYLRIKDSWMCGANLLPNCITRFYHLLVLDVQYHRGELGFLREMGNLLKLRHFLVHDDNIHSNICEVGKLIFLHELRKFEVKREMKGFDLEQIGQLLELRGSLSIYNLEKVEEIKEADDAKLACINHLDRGRELTQVLSHFPKLSNLLIRRCQNVARLGVAEQRTITTPESSLSPSANKAAKTLTTIPQQQTGEAEEMETATADDGLLLLPPQIKVFKISECRELSLDSGGIQGLLSLQTLGIYDCPKLLCSSSSSYSPFPTSLQTLALWNVEGMETLPSPLPNLTWLWINSCGNLRGGEVLCDLLAQGNLIFLSVHETPNFFLGLEHSCSQVDKQEDVHRSWRLQELGTDDFARVLATPVCHLLSSSLTKLVLRWNDEVECFTKEQEKALHILNSIEGLQFWSCEKLQSLPAGLSQIPTIKALQIHSCPAITSLRNLPNSLQQLEISSCPAISSLGNLPNSLQQLWISYCPAISSLGNLPNSLQRLGISYCPAISSLGNLPNSLQQLVIYDCPSISSLDGTTIGSLPKDRLPTSLREINVRSCGNEELKRQCRKLQGTIPIVQA
ncbi:hypothetical protein OsI_38326 [Oryza sativa Indica Group]|uniref:AAA+ ATPase domain-containing protein n=1 Tax=Oryza sativa subsp. indica TaxID=39946 RepID=A2ZKH5_ORYSI|nr:hypothetical protein OsI_38326 [Oryza sativa Indica Group]